MSDLLVSFFDTRTLACFKETIIEESNVNFEDSEALLQLMKSYDEKQQNKKNRKNRVNHSARLIMSRNSEEGDIPSHLSSLFNKTESDENFERALDLSEKSSLARDKKKNRIFFGEETEEVDMTDDQSDQSTSFSETRSSTTETSSKFDEFMMIDDELNNTKKSENEFDIEHQHQHENQRTSKSSLSRTSEPKPSVPLFLNHSPEIISSENQNKNNNNNNNNNENIENIEILQINKEEQEQQEQEEENNNNKNNTKNKNKNNKNKNDNNNNNKSNNKNNSSQIRSKHQSAPNQKRTIVNTNSGEVDENIETNPKGHKSNIAVRPTTPRSLSSQKSPKTSSTSTVTSVNEDLHKVGALQLPRNIGLSKISTTTTIKGNTVDSPRNSPRQQLHHQHHQHHEHHQQHHHQHQHHHEHQQQHQQNEEIKSPTKIKANPLKKFLKSAFGGKQSTQQQQQQQQNTEQHIQTTQQEQEHDSSKENIRETELEFDDEQKHNEFEQIESRQEMIGIKSNLKAKSSLHEPTKPIEGRNFMRSTISYRSRVQVVSKVPNFGSLGSDPRSRANSGEPKFLQRAPATPRWANEIFSDNQ